MPFISASAFTSSSALGVDVPIPVLPFLRMTKASERDPPPVPLPTTNNLSSESQVNVSFGQFCLISNESEFSIRADHIVSILEPRAEVEERYVGIVYPQETEVTELTTQEAPADESESVDS